MTKHAARHNAAPFLALRDARGVALVLPALALAADLAGAPVERAPDGAPLAWRVLAFGPFSITQHGQTYAGEFTPDAAALIMEHYERKGVRVPLDSRHFTYRLAQELKVDEADVVRLLGPAATFGFVALESRADGLWATDAEYHPLGRRLVAEGILRHYSPVIRGLADGRLRLTSITLTNEPAIDRCDAIAAEADPETTPVAGDMHTLTARLGALAAAQGNRNRNTDRRGNVDKLLKMIGQLLGRDAVALEADGDAPADVLAGIETLATEVAGLRTERAERVAFLGKARDALALEGEPSLDAVQGAIAGLAAKAGQADALRIRVDALALEGETRRKAEVVARLTSEGKLTRAMLENWVPGQDVAALEAYAQHAPRLVPVGERVGRDTLPAADALALTAEEIEVAKSCGLKPEEVLAEKKIRAGLTA